MTVKAMTVKHKPETLNQQFTTFRYNHNAYAWWLAMIVVLADHSIAILVRLQSHCKAKLFRVIYGCGQGMT